MKKHNKDVLKATLFALIAIFIMIGAAGLLFAEHKKKIQKEQQKKAAIEALERVPTVTPTPAATATPTPGAYGHSDTDSCDHPGTGVRGK